MPVLLLNMNNEPLLFSTSPDAGNPTAIPSVYCGPNGWSTSVTASNFGCEHGEGCACHSATARMSEVY